MRAGEVQGKILEDTRFVAPAALPAPMSHLPAPRVPGGLVRVPVASQAQRRFFSGTMCRRGSALCGAAAPSPALLGPHGVRVAEPGGDTATVPLHLHTCGLGTAASCHWRALYDIYSPLAPWYVQPVSQRQGWQSMGYGKPRAGPTALTGAPRCIAIPLRRACAAARSCCRAREEDFLPSQRLIILYWIIFSCRCWQ